MGQEPTPPWGPVETTPSSNPLLAEIKAWQGEQEPLGYALDWLATIVRYRKRMGLTVSPEWESVLSFAPGEPVEVPGGIVTVLEEGLWTGEWQHQHVAQAATVLARYVAIKTKQIKKETS